MRQLAPHELSWLAAAIDGEGSITFGTHKRGTNFVSVLIFNTNKDYVLFGARLIGAKIERQDRTPHKTMYTMILAKQTEVKSLLSQILPYLIIKRERAEYCLAWLEDAPIRWAERSRKISEKAKLYYQNPANREKMSTAIKKSWEKLGPQERQRKMRGLWWNNATLGTAVPVPQGRA